MSVRNTSDEFVERPSAWRRMLHKFVPANFNNVFSLAYRLIFQGDSAGRMAMVYSAAGLALTPLDLFLQIFEKRLYRAAGQPQQPQIFVCGAPRSGTTVTAQALIKYLPVHYFNNLTSLFPRSPIMAGKLFGWLIRKGNKDLTFKSFYGRTNKLFHTNDALYFWDRWTGHDRKDIPESFTPLAQKDLVQFFGAVEKESGRPLINKNNSLNTYANLVAEIMPNAYFICLDRIPLYLAQSHYSARKFIHGDETVSYGIRGNTKPTDDPIEDICRQVLFHRNCIRRQQEIIGKERFIIVPYEDFCSRPAHWVKFVGEQIIGVDVDEDALQAEMPPFKVSKSRKIDEATFARIEQTLEELEHNQEFK